MADGYLRLLFHVPAAGCDSNSHYRQMDNPRWNWKMPQHDHVNNPYA